MITRRSILASGLVLLCMRASAAEQARSVPSPTLDEEAGATSSAVAVLAGGCFWGVQAVYQRTKGVLSAVSGYAGGEKASATYGVVSGGKTGHAEAVRITYDPKEITYGQLLQIFFAVVHDPTQLNRQGPDIGPQYRSAIFPVNDGQARIARAYLAQIEQAESFDVAVVTKIEQGKAFYPAEEYHQDYLVNNPRQPYILFHDMPKLAEMKRVFPERWREQPVLVKPPRRLGRLGQGSQAFYQGLPGGS
ncbi:MAG: peptide-methionine (S)-S-oxide reductase MsrA [Proteobacteria bacterium]|nr:peptide-methionine (S)-S-oxide reductase MsrA [Pseudomonadota bacterium]